MSIGHACDLSHCQRCGECIPEPRLLCDVCRKPSADKKTGGVGGVPDAVPAKPDLSLVDFEDIWEELRRRFDTVVLAANKNLSDKKCQDTLKYSGTYLIGQGLCFRLLADIEEGVRENAKSHEEVD